MQGRSKKTSTKDAISTSAQTMPVLNAEDTLRDEQLSINGNSCPNQTNEECKKKACRKSTKRLGVLSIESDECNGCEAFNLESLVSWIPKGFIRINLVYF